MKNYIEKLIRIIEKIASIIAKNLRWIVFFICVIVFIKIVENIFQEEISIFDNVIYHKISKIISNPVTAIMKIITEMGDAICLISICVLTLIYKKTRKYGKYITSNLVIIAILNKILKNIFERPRPEGFRIIEAGGYSFPSGHSMASMAFYGFIIYLIYKKVKNPYLKWGGIAALGLLVLSIGISRIYLGVHYASDVIGGFCFSIAFLCLYTQCAKMFKPHLYTVKNNDKSNRK